MLETFDPGDGCKQSAVNIAFPTTSQGVYPQNLVIGASSIAMERNNLNPSHSGNTFSLRFKAIDFEESTEMCLKRLRWACFPIKSRKEQWVHLFFLWISMISRPFTLFFSLKVHCRW